MEEVSEAMRLFSTSWASCGMPVPGSAAPTSDTWSPTIGPLVVEVLSDEDVDCSCELDAASSARPSMAFVLLAAAATPKRAKAEKDAKSHLLILEGFPELNRLSIRVNYIQGFTELHTSDFCFRRGSAFINFQSTFFIRGGPIRSLSGDDAFPLLILGLPKANRISAYWLCRLPANQANSRQNPAAFC